MADIVTEMRAVPLRAADTAAYLLRHFALDIALRVHRHELGGDAVSTANQALTAADQISPPSVAR